MSQAHNHTLTQKTRHKALQPVDFLMFGEKPDRTEAELERTFADLGIQKRHGS